MSYVTIELQTDEEGRTASIVTAHADRNGAEGAYHAALAAAAVSPVPVHAVVLLEGDGTYMEGRCYEHGEGE